MTQTSQLKKFPADGDEEGELSEEGELPETKKRNTMVCCLNILSISLCHIQLS